MTRLVAAIFVLVLAMPALAAPPPPDALPLSDIILTLESEEINLHYISEIEWDSDGYWEIDYVERDGRRVEVKIDPITGLPWQRN